MFSGFKQPSLRINPWLFATLGALVISYIVYSPRLPLRLDIKIGDVSTQTIRSPQYIEFQTKEDVAKTNKLRTTRRKLIKPIYTIDPTIQKKINEDVISFFTDQQKIRAGERTPYSPDAFLSPPNKAHLNQLSQNQLILFEAQVLTTLSTLLQTGIKDINVSIIQDHVISTNKRTLSRQDMDLISAICDHYLVPNLIIDTDKTQAIIDQQMNAIQPFITSFKSGQVIISKGDILNDFHMDVLKALKLYGSKNNTINFLGIFIITSLLFIFFERFLYFFYKKMHENPAIYTLSFTWLCLILIIALGIFSLPNIKHINTLYFLIPLPVMIILLCVLLTPNIAMVSGTITAILIAIMYQNNLYILLFLFFSTCTTTFACHHIYRRSDLVIAGNMIGLINILIILAIGTLSDITNLVWYLYNGIIGFSNGFICAMLSFAFLPYFESLFRITTSLGLIETANLNHPLLKKLLLNAPGTYQHSLMVANLSEAAAESIGADVVLSRIGAYFHDIGKMKRPIFFSENQFSNGNPHENLSPRMSKIIIAAHAKDGVEMAQKFKLPVILQNIMLEHHGTSLVSFFYDVAKQQTDDDTNSLEDDFRYPGPKPQSKESGIIMLADTTEAAIRSIEKPTLTKIENLIEKVFIMKMTDHQLDESGLSLNDIKRIKATFLTIFKSIYHSRLDYEEELSKIIHQTKSKFNDT
jgi:putative nucleotidyltransferase with HDIG domain